MNGFGSERNWLTAQSWRRLVGLTLLLTYEVSVLPAPDFNRDVRSILSGKCFKCHGPDAEARKANLRLDKREAAIAGGAIVPGNPGESELIHRLLSDDPDSRMPPSGESLPVEQIDMLRRWIQNGAAYDAHWSFQFPKRAPKPEVNETEWPERELDFFVLSQIEAAGLQPSVRAEPAVLLRRLHLDLVGLPPSVEDVIAFEADPSVKVYEAHVERLLNSKHFGEKWAAGWLDLARYADSNGYQHDDLRTQWPYRDWVINALNADMPFDQFTIEQLAGDLLPNPTTQQLVATGFHRNVPANFSGGAKVDEVRANILHDRVSTTGTVWLGLTLECAQCHDHKFDAISQREYYQFYAYYNQAVPEIAQKGVDMFKKFFVGREVIVYESKDKQRKAEALIELLADKERSFPKEVAISAKSPTKGEITLLDFETKESIANNNQSHVAITTMVADTPDGGGRFAAKTDVALTAGADGFFGTGFSFAERDLSELESIQVWIKTDIVGSFNLQVHNADNRASVFGFSTVGAQAETWTRIRAPVTQFTQPPWSKGAVDWSEVSKVQVTAYGNGPYDGRYITVDRVEGQEFSERSKRERELDRLRNELASLQTSTMVMEDAKNPEQTHLMIRGDYTLPGDPVYPGTLAALHPLAEELPKNRLGLARWLVSPENPLTARVAVNRIWGELFGRGIVTTPEDFGMQGEAPSHPELLDWLALRFVENDWSQKALIKSIVMSATYQQSSAASERLGSVDPGNSLYARGPRFRLSAELVRDSLLAVSGLLSQRVGGPMVYPAQPDGLWKEILGVMDVSEYPTSVGVDRYRRGIYTVWRRGNPYPSMINFDAPDRSVCIAKRDRSNTPLQALTLLNDPAYVEMAEQFSSLIEAWGSNDRESLIRAFRTVVARRPSGEELKILEGLRERRGWFAVAQALLNLDEAITKS